ASSNSSNSRPQPLRSERATREPATPTSCPSAPTPAPPSVSHAERPRTTHVLVRAAFSLCPPVNFPWLIAEKLALATPVSIGPLPAAQVSHQIHKGLDAPFFAFKRVVLVAKHHDCGAAQASFGRRQIMDDDALD